VLSLLSFQIFLNMILSARSAFDRIQVHWDCFAFAKSQHVLLTQHVKNKIALTHF